MKTTLIAVALIAMLQEVPVVPIGKQNAAPYRSALQKYQEAKAALDRGDITTAYDKATEIYEDTSKVKTINRECLLKLQQSDSTWEQPQEFFPVKVRCGAMVAQAKKQIADGKKEDAVAKLQAAAKDIKESVGRNVAGAAAMEKEIEKLILENSTNEEDPAVIKRRAYDAKVKEALKAKDDGKLELARQLFQQAIAIDETLNDAKEGVAKVDALIKEEAAFSKYKTGITGSESTMEDLRRKADACDAFLKDFPNGAHATEVAATRDTITGKMLAKAGDEKRKRELEFENGWTQLRSKGKYKSAIEWLQKKEAPFGPDRLKEMEQETILASDQARDNAADRLLMRLGSVESFDSGIGRSIETLEIPDDAELVRTHPMFNWFKAFKAAMRELKAMGKDAEPAKIAEVLKQLWSDSVALGDKAENPFFRAVESILRDIYDRRLRALVKDSRTASTDDLKKIKLEANALLSTIDEFDAKLTRALAAQPDKGKAWRDANTYWGSDITDLKAYPNDFPRDAAEIETAAKALTDWEAPDGVFGKAPQPALERIERDLQNVERNIGRSLSRDARRKLFTLLVVARSMRLLLDGKKVEDVVTQMGDFAEELKKTGGAVADETAKYGPKIEKVFAAIK